MKDLQFMSYFIKSHKNHSFLLHYTYSPWKFQTKILQLVTSMFITSIPRQKKATTLLNEISKASQSFYEMLEATCHICSHLYNSSDQLPISICAEEHTYCSKCVVNLFNLHPHGTRCPTCRAYIYQKGIHVNKSLLRMCDLLPKLALKFANLEVQNQQLTQKITKYQMLLLHKQSETTVLGSEDRYLNQGKSKCEEKKKFPVIVHENQGNRAKKMNIHNYLARKRILSSRKVEKKDRKENYPLSFSKNLI